MHILANMRSEICIKGRLIISSKFVTIWVVTRGGGGSRQTVTKCDKGEGGPKNGCRTVTFLRLFEWPLIGVSKQSSNQFLL